MFMQRIRLKTVDNTPIAKPQGYPFRITSFLISLGVHCALITAIAFVSIDQDLPIRATSSDLSQLNIHKVLIYDIRTKTLDVTPLKSSGLSLKLQGNEVSKQAVIATSPNAKSTEQFIWQPVPKLQIKQDLRIPNMIARMATSLPAPPAPPKEKPPRPEVEGVKAAQQNDSPAQSKGDLNHAPDSLIKAVETPKPVKAFVPPPPLPRQPQLPVPSPMLDAPALQGGSVAMNRQLPAGTGMPVFSKGSVPPPVAPVASVATPGNANIDIAIASLHPNDANNELPEGDRPGRFAKAPTKGAPGTGEVNGSASLTVPNLTIREDRTKPGGVSENKSNLKTTLYAERVRSVGTSTLSVPLRPSSRTIPRAVEARFQGRNVYTMVIPIENFPAYAGDWIIWFAEKEPKTGETPLMRAPLPFRKFEPVDQVAVGNPAGERVQIMGALQKDGKLDGLTAVAKAGPVVEQAAIRDVTSWEFKPATRNGMPVTVEVVIEISLVYSPPLEKRAQP